MVEDKGDDGGSESSDLVAKRGERRKTNTEDERKRIRVTLPGSVHLWTQSRGRGLDRCGNQVRWVSAGFFFFRRFERKGKKRREMCRGFLLLPFKGVIFVTISRDIYISAI